METNNQEDRALEAMLKEAAEAFAAEEGVKEEMREELGFGRGLTQMNADGRQKARRHGGTEARREGEEVRGEGEEASQLDWVRETASVVGDGTAKEDAWIRERAGAALRSAPGVGGGRRYGGWGRRVVGVAACLGVVMLVWWAFEGKGVEQSAYAQLVEAVAGTRAAEWVHLRTEVNGQVVEAWVAMGPFRNISKGGGQIKYEDYQAGKEYVYEAASNTLKIGEVGDVPEVMKKQNFLEVILGVVEGWKAAGNVEVTERQETVGGRTLTVFAIVNKKPEDGQLAELRVDPKVKRIVSMTMIKEVIGQKLSKPMTVELDYPEEGPADVYAVGVPRDAKVVDLSPGKDVKELQRKVAAAVEGFAPSYVAVICTEHSGSSAGPGYRVVYKKNGRYRVEHYPSYVPRQDPGAEDMKAIEAYLAKKPVSGVSFKLGTHESAYISLDEEGKLKVERSRELAVFTTTVEWEAWRSTGMRVPTYVSQSQKMTRIVPAENAADAGLIIEETTNQGFALGDRTWRSPRRSRKYFDPQHDLLCQRSEELTTFQAPWQQGEELLKDIQGDPDMLRYKSQFVWTVLEYGKTPGGQWYPRKLRMEHEARGKETPEGKAQDYASTELITIHLDTTREIADEMMEPEKVGEEVFKRGR